MEKNSKVHIVDVLVGKRLKARRTIIGISQEELGKAVGITFQQIQKYEKGQNRMSVSRLFELSRALGVNISYFYEQVYNEVLSPSKHITNLAENQDNFIIDSVEQNNKEIATLVRSYLLIHNQVVRKKVLELIKSLATAKS